MVIDDIFTTKRPKPPRYVPSKETIAAQRLARPLDRLAANVADLMLILPIASIVMAPFRKQALISELVSINSEASHEHYVSGLVLSAIVIVLYQTLFVYFYGATPGKMFMGLKVVSIWGNSRPRSIFCQLRSIVWCCELIFLGIPWLGVFANERRRPFHDRVADTIVISTREHRFAPPPSPSERSIMGGIYAAVLAFAAILLVVSLETYSSLNPNVSREVAQRGRACPIIGEAEGDWIDSGSKESQRLAVGLSLFIAELIDEECLEPEADYVLMRENLQKDFDLAYAAKALIHAGDEQLSEKYRVQACAQNEDSDFCKLIAIERERDLWSKGDSENYDQPKLEELLASVSVDSAQYLRILAIDELSRLHKFDAAISLLRGGAPSATLGPYFAIHRAKSLWNLDRKAEANVALESTLENLDQSRKLDLAQWFCLQQTRDACDDEAKLSCGSVMSAVSKSEKILKDPTISLAYIRAHECRSGGRIDVAEVSGSLPLEEAKQFVVALDQIRHKQNGKAKRTLEYICNSVEEENPYFYEAKSRLAELSKSTNELDSLVGDWQKSEPGAEGWVKFGHQLRKRLASLGDYKRSLDVGLRLIELDPFSRELREAVVISAYRSGDPAQAELLLDFEDRVKRGFEGRSPASASRGEFELVREELELRAKRRTQ